MTTFELTIGVISSDNLYMSSYGMDRQAPLLSSNTDWSQVSLEEYSCDNVYDAMAPVPNSNDPYVYVDPWTDRIMKFDMHALLGMTVEWSDDDGGSWFGPSVATGWSVQDHQTIASSPYPALPPNYLGLLREWELPISCVLGEQRWWIDVGPGAPRNSFRL